MNDSLFTIHDLPVVPPCPLWLLSFIYGHKFNVFWPRVVGAGPDDLAVGALLHDVGSPARYPRHDEDGREHGCGYAHEPFRFLFPQEVLHF